MERECEGQASECRGCYGWRVSKKTAKSNDNVYELVQYGGCLLLIRSMTCQISASVEYVCMYVRLLGRFGKTRSMQGVEQPYEVRYGEQNAWEFRTLCRGQVYIV